MPLATSAPSPDRRESVARIWLKRSLLLALLLAPLLAGTPAGSVWAAPPSPTDTPEVDLALFAAPSERAPVFAGGIPAADPELHYEVAGEGETVVLIHGAALDSRMWDRQFRLLAGTHRVIRYDVRGFGRSPPVTEPYSHVEDLLFLLDATGSERVTLVGLSLGGAIAINFTLTHPERVDRLLLVGPALPGAQPTSEAVEAFQSIGERVRAGDLHGAVEAWLTTPHMRPAMENETLAPLVRSLALDNRASWAPTAPVSVHPPASQRLGEISVPTRVLVGGRDAGDVQAQARTIVDGVPDASLNVIPDVGHVPNLEAPKEFGRWLAASLEAPKAPRFASASVARLAWLAGCWEGTLSTGATYEEAWLAPRGGLMVGVARMTRDGRTISFEFMRIAREHDGTPIYHAQPSGRPPTPFPATELTEASVTFENQNHDFPQRILYRIGPPDELNARIEGRRDGQPDGFDLPLRRVPCPG